MVELTDLDGETGRLANGRPDAVAARCRDESAGGGAESAWLREDSADRGGGRGFEKSREPEHVRPRRVLYILCRAAFDHRTVDDPIRRSSPRLEYYFRRRAGHAGADPHRGAASDV